MDLIEIHCSALANWALCEKAALWRMMDPGTGDEPIEHVATWMGSAVHARVAEEDPPDEPKLIVFDKMTPNIKYARAQVERMAEAVTDKLIEVDWFVITREREVAPVDSPNWIPQLRLVGRTDLDVISASGITITADVKTSKEFFPAWIQLGGYALMQDPEPVRVATIHCPRAALVQDQPPVEIYYADAAECADEAARIMSRISELLEDGSKAVAAPGNRCRFCKHPTCVVRSRDYSPR